MVLSPRSYNMDFSRFGANNVEDIIYVIEGIIGTEIISEYELAEQQRHLGE